MPDPDAQRKRRAPTRSRPHPKRTPPARKTPRPRRLCRCPRDSELRFISLFDTGRRVLARLRLPVEGEPPYSAGYFPRPESAIFHRRMLLREIGCTLDDSSEVIAAAMRRWLVRNPWARRKRGRPRRR